MPRVNIYIRNEDVEAWEAIDNKSEWIHDQLQEGKPSGWRPEPGKSYADTKAGKSLIDWQQGKLLQAAKDKVVNNKPRNTTGFCPNGHPIPEGRTKCMGKGCKYS